MKKKRCFVLFDLRKNKNSNLISPKFAIKLMAWLAKDLWLFNKQIEESFPYPIQPHANQNCLFVLIFFFNQKHRNIYLIEKSYERGLHSDWSWD